MSNLQISVDLLALTGAFVENRQGQDGNFHPCVVIPADIAKLSVWSKENDANSLKVFLNAVAWEAKEKKYDNTHYIKQSFPKEVTDAMTDEQKKSIPILGNGKVIEPKKPNLATAISPQSIANDPRVQMMGQAIGANSYPQMGGQDGGKLPF